MLNHKLKNAFSFLWGKLNNVSESNIKQAYLYQRLVAQGETHPIPVDMIRELIVPVSQKVQWYNFTTMKGNHVNVRSLLGSPNLECSLEGGGYDANWFVPTIKVAADPHYGKLSLGFYKDNEQLVMVPMDRLQLAYGESDQIGMVMEKLIYATLTRVLKDDFLRFDQYLTGSPDGLLHYQDMITLYEDDDVLMSLEVSCSIGIHQKNDTITLPLRIYAGAIDKKDEAWDEEGDNRVQIYPSPDIFDIRLLPLFKREMFNTVEESAKAFCQWEDPHMPPTPEHFKAIHDRYREIMEGFIQIAKTYRFETPNHSPRSVNDVPFATLHAIKQYVEQLNGDKA